MKQIFKLKKTDEVYLKNWGKTCYQYTIQVTDTNDIEMLKRLFKYVRYDWEDNLCIHCWDDNRHEMTVENGEYYYNR